MKSKPNVIYILADDMGYGDVSALNQNCGFKTPNLDNMVKDGIAFSDAHSTSAVCTPSRYAIMTGRYNWRSKLKSGVLGGYSTPLIEKDRTTVAQMLKQSGYRTSAIGKWHLGMDFSKTDDFIEFDKFASSYDMCDGIKYDEKIENSPNTRGFDYYFGIAGSLDMPPYVYIENDRFTALPDHKSIPERGFAWYRPGVTAPDFVHEEVLDVFADKVVDEIDRLKNDDFFIYFPMPAPHGPIMPNENFRGKSGINAYCDFVMHCDSVVGKIINKLKDEGLYEDTIVIFTADNGCSPIAKFDEMAEKGHNPSYKFRGHKADIFEGGHRIPLLMTWGNGIKAGQMCNETVCLSDFMATMADIIGYKLEDNEAEDSVSNLPLFKNAKSGAVRDYTVHQSVDGSLAIRKGKYKLEMCVGSGGWTYPRPEDYTDDMPRFQLYNLEEDIGETTNIINDNQEIYIKMRELLKQCVKNGRSTIGAVQKNNGQQVWDTIAWIEENT